MTSGPSDAGPMVQTIRVLWAGRITNHPRDFGSSLIPEADVQYPPYQDRVAAGCQFVYSGGDGGNPCAVGVVSGD